jgi:translation initiation factor 3 subunit M
MAVLFSASNLFNKTVSLPALRFDTLLAVIDYASKTDNTALVTGYFDDVESLFVAANLTADKHRQLYLAIADVLAKQDAKRYGHDSPLFVLGCGSHRLLPLIHSIKVLLFLEKYLGTFVGADAAAAAAGKDVAVRAVTRVLQNPTASFVARVDLVANPAVVALKGDKLFELLQIVSTQTLAEYTAFAKAAGAAFFEKHGLVDAELASTMRLFTLCSLPTGFDMVPFEKIAAALAIDEDDVEKWVVKAITANLVSAKVDQLNRTVVITRVLQRGFGTDQWNDVHAKLQLYKKNVGALLEVVRNARQAHQK